ncbi:hypothetical protein DFH06DRAFT_1164548, partial [Mycena polygramma]
MPFPVQNFHQRLTLSSIMTSTTPQSDSTIPLKARILTTITGSNFRVSQWKKSSAAAKEKVDANVLYIPSDEYSTFEREFGMLTNVLKTYDDAMQAGQWLKAIRVSGSVRSFHVDVVETSIKISGTAILRKDACVEKHKTIPKIEGRCPVCFANEIGTLSFRSSQVRETHVVEETSSNNGAVSSDGSSKGTPDSVNLPTVAPSDAPSNVAVPQAESGNSANIVHTGSSGDSGQPKRQKLMFADMKALSKMENETLTMDVYADFDKTVAVWKRKP